MKNNDAKLLASQNRKSDTVEFQIRIPRRGDIDWMTSSFEGMGWSKPEGHFDRYIEEQAAGLVNVFCAETREGMYVGHLKLVWNPNYSYFREHDIPEIQDLNVLPQFRRMKAGTMLVEQAERTVIAKRPKVGIGFGLYSDYGPAQRMYIRLGYVPDGQGVSYRNSKVAPGENVSVDDDLTLFLVKDLRK